MSAAMGALASDANAGAVRDAHRFDETRLKDWLSAHIDTGGGFAVRQFSGGQSNPTFLIETGGRKYVMRKKPPGALLKGAHQVDRESRRDAVAARGVLAVDDKKVGLVLLAQKRNGGAHGIAARFTNNVAKENEFHESVLTGGT